MSTVWKLVIDSIVFCSAYWLKNHSFKNHSSNVHACMSSMAKMLTTYFSKMHSKSLLVKYFEREKGGNRERERLFSFDILHLLYSSQMKFRFPHLLSASNFKPFFSCLKYFLSVFYWRVCPFFLRVCFSLS